MATAFNQDKNGEIGCLYGSWSLAAGENGVAVETGRLTDVTIHAQSGFGTSTLTWQGSNDPVAVTDPASADWVTVLDIFEDAMTWTSAGAKTCANNFRYMRPTCSAGSATACKVSICAKRS